MRRLLPALAGALLFGWSDAAQAELHSVTAAADTYVRRDNKGPYGAEPLLTVKNKGDGSKTRKALVRFNLSPAAAHDPFEAKLDLAVAGYPESGTTSFYVYGILHPALAGRQCQAAFDEASLKYKSSHMDWLDDSGDGLDDSSRCIFGKAPLGKFTVSPGQQIASFSSPELLEYIRANTEVSGGQVTFYFQRVGKDDDGIDFAAKEHPTLPPPTLSWSNRDALGFEGGAPLNRGQSGVQTFNGVLRIPLAGGTAITFPGAQVTATYEGHRLKTFSGTVGMPQMPDSDLLGALSLNGPGLQIGYDYPMAFDTVGLPLRQDRKYFFLRQESGVSISVADVIELAPPTGGGTTVIALDPATATLLSYSSAIPFGIYPIEDVAVGFSATSGLWFTPYDNEGVESVLKAFGGNLYAGATIELDLKKLTTSDRVDFSASLHGEAMVNADVTGFVSRNQDWLRRLGMNGSATLNASVGEYTGLSLELAQGSIGYERYGGGGNLPRFAFAGGASAPHLPGMPFQLNGRVHVAGVIDTNNNGLNSYIQLDGSFNPSVPFPLKLEGTMTLGPTQGKIAGKVKFAGSSIKAEGTFSKSRIKVSGSFTEDFSEGGWGFKATVKPTVELTPSSVDVDVQASAKACMRFSGKDYCDGTSVNSKDFDPLTGKFKVCVGGNRPFSFLPRIPKTCRTF